MAFPTKVAARGLLLAMLWGSAPLHGAEPPQLAQVRQTMEQLDTYLQELNSQIETLTAQAEAYLDKADAETDPLRQAKFEQLHMDLSARLDDLLFQQERAQALQHQTRQLMEQLEPEPSEHGP